MNRPRGVTIVAWLNILGGCLLLFGSSVFAMMSAQITAFLILSLWMAFVGALDIIVGVSLLEGKRWAYYFSMVIWVMNVLMGLVNGSGFGVLIPLVFIVYFLNEKVQNFFTVDVGWSWT